MTEHPLFVPCGDGVLAAIVTLPEGRPRGVVVNVTGTVLTANFGSYLCRRLAAPLAERGFASVRFDFSGAGDSPGQVSDIALDSIDWALEAATAALNNVRAITGVREFAAVGTCYGTRIVFRLMHDPDCVGAVCLAPVLLETRAWSRMRTRYHKRSLISVIRKSRLLRRVLLKPVKVLIGEKKPALLVLDALRQLDHARLRLVVSNFPRDHYSPLALKGLEQAKASLSPEQRRRLNVQLVGNDGPLSTFEFMPAETQASTVESVIDEITTAFDERTGSVGAAGTPELTQTAG